MTGIHTLKRSTYTALAWTSLVSRSSVDTFIQPGCQRGFTSVSRKLRRFKSADSLRDLASSRHCSLMRTTSHSSDLFARHSQKLSSQYYANQDIIKKQKLFIFSEFLLWKCISKEKVPVHL